MIPSKFDRVAKITSQNEADSLVKECTQDLKVIIDPIAPFSATDAERITRKNIVMAAIKYGSEILARAELLFQQKNPLSEN